MLPARCCRAVYDLVPWFACKEPYQPAAKCAGSFRSQSVQYGNWSVYTRFEGNAMQRETFGTIGGSVRVGRELESFKSSVGLLFHGSVELAARQVKVMWEGGKKAGSCCGI